MASPQKPSRLLFRIPGTAHLAILLLLVCETPVAFAAPGLLAIYLIPVALAVWVWRTRTVATAEGLVVRRLFTKKELPWSSLRGLRLAKRGQVSAETLDGAVVPLPAVRIRHLSALSLISDGRIDDPTEPPPGSEPEPAEPAESTQDSEDTEDTEGTEPAEGAASAEAEPNGARE